MNWIPESKSMCYRDEKIKVTSLNNQTVLFYGFMHDLSFRFSYSPDNVEEDNKISIYPDVFRCTKLFPHRILGSENLDVARLYKDVINYDESNDDAYNYSPHVFLFESENAELFHARLKKSNVLGPSTIKPPYALHENELTKTYEAYKYNLYYCPIRQLIAAGQTPLDYTIRYEPPQWYYEFVKYIESGDFSYPDGRIISKVDGDSLVERNFVTLQAWKDAWIEKKILYAIEKDEEDNNYKKDVRVTFESDFTENALFVFDGTFSRKSEKRIDVNYPSGIAYFHIHGKVSTLGRQDEEVEKTIRIYDQGPPELFGIPRPNFTNLFEGSVFPSESKVCATANPAGLDDLIGLEKVKKTFEDFRCFGEFLKNKNKQGDIDTSGDRLIDVYMRKIENIQLSADDSVALHMAFLGSPGTGKTTVAERVAAMLKKCRLVVKNEKPVIVVKSDLVGQFIGHTEENVREKIKEAMGGILFIDEAYTLFEDRNDSKDFGKIALNEIMYAMERYRDKLVVIFAGYTDEMLNMLKNANPGLASRIPWKFEFEDYSASEMWDILKLKVNKGGYKFEDEDSAKELATRYFGELKQKYDNVFENGSKKYYFGNGRGVRTFFQNMEIELAIRCYKADVDMQTFIKRDIELAYDRFMHHTEKLVITEKTSIGFIN